MTKLQQRLLAYRQKQLRRTLMKTYVKVELKRVLALFVIFSMLFSIIKLPVAYAYFKAGPVASDAITLQIINNNNPQNSSASITFPDPFLMEDEESLDLQKNAAETESMTFAADQLAGDKEQQLRVAGNITTIKEEEKDDERTELQPEDLLYAEIELEAGFCASDIFWPSVELQHEANITPALSGEMTTDSILLTAFDRAEVKSWFEGAPDTLEEATFQVSGDGYIGGLEHFRFNGEASLLLKGSYEIITIKVSGPTSLYIPVEKDETVTETYQLLDQVENPVTPERDLEQSSITELTWELDSPHKGVELHPETAELRVTSPASPGELTLLATVKIEEQNSQRILTAQKTLELFPAPQLEIQGAGEITVPLPGDSLSETYEIELIDREKSDTSQDEATPEFDQVTWALEEEIKGVELQDSTVTVRSDAAAEGFTLSVRVQLDSITLDAEKQVLLETVPVHDITIAGDSELPIPREDEAAITANYEAAVYDQEDKELPGEPVTWELSAKTSGIELSDAGVLTVNPGVQSETVSIRAFSLRNPDVFAEKTITLLAPVVEEPEPETKEEDPEEDGEETTGGGRDSDETTPGSLPEIELTIAGPHLILLVQETEQMVPYQAVDQQGEPLDDITWSILEEDVKGVSVDPDGMLYIDVEAGEIRFTLQAAQKQQTDQEAAAETEESSKTIELTGQKEITLALPAPTDIEIEGPGSVTIPEDCCLEAIPDADPEEESHNGDEKDEPAGEPFDFTALVLDQLGGLLEDEAVTWEMKEEVEGIYLDSETGVLYVTGAAEPGEITIIAVSISNEEIRAEFTVQLEHAEDHEEAEDPEDPEEAEEEQEPEEKEDGELPDGIKEDDPAIIEEEEEDDNDDDQGHGGGGGGGNTDTDNDGKKEEDSDEENDDKEDSDAVDPNPDKTSETDEEDIFDEKDSKEEDEDDTEDDVPGDETGENEDNGQEAVKEDESESEDEAEDEEDIDELDEDESDSENDGDGDEDDSDTEEEADKGEEQVATIDEDEDDDEDEEENEQGEEDEGDDEGQDSVLDEDGDDDEDEGDSDDDDSAADDPVEDSDNSDDNHDTTEQPGEQPDDSGDTGDTGDTEDSNDPDNNNTNDVAEE